jgi:hypothetical protein
MSMRTTPAALPTFGELSFDLLSTAATGPWLLDGLQRSHGLFQNRLGPGKLLILDPEFGPAIDGRQFARGGRKIEILSEALDIVGGENVSQVTDHQGIFGAVNLLHFRSIDDASAAPQRLFS